MGCCGWGKVGKMGQMAQNFTLSLSNAITHAMKTKKILAPQETIRNRVTICKSCEFLKNHRCTICGCFIVAKAGLDSEKCPKEKW